MKKLIALTEALMLLACCFAGIAETAAETPVPVMPGQTAEAETEEAIPEETLETEEAEPEIQLPLTGKIIGIDAGHQLHSNKEKEAVAPGSKEKKAKVSSGTQGRWTKVPEYEVDLQVSLQLRDALEALGATVIMVRETNDVNISNQERAKMMNEAGCDLVLRIHCNGSEKSSANGIGLYVRKTGTAADECLAAAKTLLPFMVEATGAKSNGVFRRDTYTGLNWSEVPSILVEMGYMTNKEEDYKLVDPKYQALLVTGMVNGITAYLGEETEAHE